MTEESESFYPQRNEFPNTCDNCDTPIKSEHFRGKGKSTDEKPLGHKDPRHTFGAYCSISCSKEHDNKGGTIYGEK
jgi:hypothetical protein